MFESHRNHGLEDLARRHVGVEDLTSYEDICGKGAKQIGFDEVAIDVATKYGAEDADLTLRVHRALYPSIARSTALDSVYRSIELPTSTVLQKIERNGVLIDADLLNRQGAELGAKMQELEAKAFELAGQPFQSRQSEADRRAVVRQAQAAGRATHGQRRAVDRRGRAGEARQRLSAAEGGCSIIARCRS